MDQRKLLKKASSGLAGALAIAGGTSAYGDIINATVPADSTVPAGTNPGLNIPWDVNGDGITDFTFVNRFPTPGGTGVEWQVNMNRATGNSVLGYGQGTTLSYGSAFSFGTPIGPVAPSGTIFTTVAQTIMGSVFTGVPYGGFAYPGAPGTGSVSPGQFSYAGFRFVVAGNTLYGWIRFAVNQGVIDFDTAAYQSTPNTAITAGARAIPEPSTMAGLAMGAVFLGGAALRQRLRKAA